MKHWLHIFAALVSLVWISCSKNPGGSSQDPSGEALPSDAVSVTIRIEGSGSDFSSEISHSIRVRETSLLEVRVTPEDSPAKITFESADLSIARVSRNGTLTGRGEGNTDITVLADGKKAAVCHLTVTEYEAVVSDFELDVSSVEVEWGSSARVVVKRIMPSGIKVGDVSFEFSSSDEGIFTVENDSDGFGCKITGETPGTGTLHASVRDATLDIPVTITKKVIGLDGWCYSSPYDDYVEIRPFQKEALTVFYPSHVDVFLWDRVSGQRVKGEYKVDNPNKETVNAAAWDDGISITAYGDGSSDEEGFGFLTLHYENDLIVSDIEDLMIEFFGCNGMHGDMTILENNPNADLYGKDLTGQTQTLSQKGQIQVILGRKSGKELKGVYRFNTMREWVKLVTDGFEVVRWDKYTHYLLARPDGSVSSPYVLYQGKYGDIKNLVVNYQLK